MPYQDGTGPKGKGPKTGQGLGNCKDGESNKYPPMRGAGRRPRKGAGRGIGRKSS